MVKRRKRENVPRKSKKEIYDSIRMSGRNFNEEMMVSLWHDYHNRKVKKYELLYYDRK